MRHWSEETNWTRIDAVVDQLKRKVEAAYFDCRDQDAAEAHDDLTSAERRLRMAERHHG